MLSVMVESGGEDVCELSIFLHGWVCNLLW